MAREDDTVGSQSEGVARENDSRVRESDCYVEGFERVYKEIETKLKVCLSYTQLCMKIPREATTPWMKEHVQGIKERHRGRLEACEEIAELLGIEI